MTDSENDLEAKLTAQTGSVSWGELKVHYERGVLVKVSPKLDLVDVGVCMAQDDAAKIGRWLEEKLLARASEADALAWQAGGQSLQALVVAPWVLVHER